MCMSVHGEETYSIHTAHTHTQRREQNGAQPYNLRTGRLTGGWVIFAGLGGYGEATDHT